MITFTLECVVGRPTSPGAEGRFSVKSNFYMRGGVVDGWWLVVGGMVCEGCRKCNHPPNKQRAEKKSHTLQKKMYCALGHFITPQKEQPRSARVVHQSGILPYGKSSSHCDGLRISTSLRSLRRLRKILYEKRVVLLEVGKVGYVVI